MKKFLKAMFNAFVVISSWLLTGTVTVPFTTKVTARPSTNPVDQTDTPVSGKAPRSKSMKNQGIAELLCADIDKMNNNQRAAHIEKLHSTRDVNGILHPNVKKKIKECEKKRYVIHDYGKLDMLDSEARSKLITLLTQAHISRVEISGMATYYGGIWNALDHRLHSLKDYYFDCSRCEKDEYIKETIHVVSDVDDRIIRISFDGLLSKYDEAMSIFTKQARDVLDLPSYEDERKREVEEWERFWIECHGE